MQFEYETLQFLWWVLVGVLLIGFALTNGMDMAVSTLLFPVCGKNLKERSALISTIVPHWDGNQVWLITAGGAIFAAWPEVYAASFSGLYWAMILVLGAIWLRPLAFDYRNHGDTERWFHNWDIALGIGSFIPMFIFGVAFGNLLQGLPFWVDNDARWHYEGVFLTALLPLLNPFALLCGAVSVLMLLTHGLLWIQLRTVPEIGDRTRKLVLYLSLATVILYLVGGLWSYQMDGWRLVAEAPVDSFHVIADKEVALINHGLFANYAELPVLIVIPVLAAGGMLIAGICGYKGRAVRAIIGSSIGISFTIITAGVALFPFLMPSSIDPSSSLTIWDASSSQFTLQVMLYVTIICVPILLAYTIYAYRRMWSRVSGTEVLKDH